MSAKTAIPADGNVLYAYFPDKINYGIAIKLTPQALSSLVKGSQDGGRLSLTLGPKGVGDPRIVSCNAV
jgi:hypothetical protein